MQSWRVCAALFAMLAATATSAGNDDARDWIMRMNKALATRNYDGVLVRQIGPRRAVLHIVHRVQDGHMNERVTSGLGQPGAGGSRVHSQRQRVDRLRPPAARGAGADT